MTKLVTGQSLNEDIANLKITRKPIIEELIYERDIFLLAADAGAGKSIFATLLCGCLSTNRPFLGLTIPMQKRVLYIQMEGDYEESIERMRYMQSEGDIIIDGDWILWCEEKTLNVMDEGSVGGFLKKIHDTKFIPEVVIIDPIYKLCHKDISSGDAALAVIRFSDYLYNKWNCTNILIHHNLKDSYAQDGQKVRRDDAYYGHSFIKNHVRTSYAMKVTGENTRDLVRMKGRGSDTRKTLHLEYNPESYVLSIADNVKEHKKGKHYERFYKFLELSRNNNHKLTAQEIIDECEITYDQLRTLKKKPETAQLYTIQKSDQKNREIWLPNIA
ncbi:AAA family ATPase [Patescibacteria group bacterium]|nr:AAA family ATPase [Patescibacteria group bacterium]